MEVHCKIWRKCIFKDPTLYLGSRAFLAKTCSSPSMCNIIVFKAQHKTHTSTAHQDELPLVCNSCLDALTIIMFADSCHYKCGFHILIALTRNFKDKTFHQCCQLALVLITRLKGSCQFFQCFISWSQMKTKDSIFIKIQLWVRVGKGGQQTFIHHMHLNGSKTRKQIKGIPKCATFNKIP